MKPAAYASGKVKEARAHRSTVPGLALALGLALVAHVVAAELGAILLRLQGLDPATAANPVSGILMAVLLGLIIRNTIGLHPLFQPGVSWSLKTVLRLGIILLGIRLSLLDALQIGLWGLPIVGLTVTAGIVVTQLIGRQLQESPRLGTLIAAATAICGITAVMATAPVINARDREITYAVATVTVFGMTAMMLYPYLAFWLFSGDAIKAGLFLGTAIHDTAQVTGAALIYSQLFGQPPALDVATVTKLLRNMFLIVVVPILAIMYTTRGARSGVQAKEYTSLDRKGPAWLRLFPTFVLGFVALAVIRSLGDAGLAGASGRALGLFSAGTWQTIISSGSKIASTYFLGTAMAAVGLNSSAAVIKELGGRPFVVGLISAVVVGMVAALLAFIFGGQVEL